VVEISPEIKRLSIARRFMPSSHAAVRNETPAVCSRCLTFREALIEREAPVFRKKANRRPLTERRIPAPETLTYERQQISTSVAFWRSSPSWSVSAKVFGLASVGYRYRDGGRQLRVERSRE
jgi:hypothetical protein